MELAPSAGGLATGLRTVQARTGGWWIGHLGDMEALSSPERVSIDDQLRALRLHAVPLVSSDAAAFYARLSNGILWPLFHDRLDRLPLRLDGWEPYERVNAAFADAVAERWRPGDMIWVHDYHLMRLPALLRARLPGARIGFFLHIPFPNPEMFLVLPSRQRLLEGLLGADLIGFHTRRYRGHFTAALRRVLGMEMDAAGYVQHHGRAVQLGIFPMGIDATALNARAASEDVDRKTREHRPAGQRLLLGIDRLDYSKGIPRRLAAFEQLLTQHPEWHRRVRFLQVAVPTRGGVRSYQTFRAEVEHLVSRINGRFATPSWTPIHYMYQSLAHDDLLALYRAADVMLVTPVRDGMNLVAKEFVACRGDERGMLVLSEFAGAAAEMTDALIVNPYDLAGVAEAVHAALLMDDTERGRRMRQLREGVFARDVHWWTREFLDALGTRQGVNAAT